MAVDEVVIQTFNYYEGPEFLPGNSEQLTQLVKYSISRLSDRTEQAERILRDAPIEQSARHLVWELDNPDQREFASGLLQDYGPSYDTVSPLIGALGNPDQREFARELLLGYGAEGLGYIKNPRPGSNLFEILTEIRDTIKAQDR